MSMLRVASWLGKVESPNKESWSRFMHMGRALLKDMPRVPLGKDKNSQLKLSKGTEAFTRNIEKIISSTEEQYNWEDSIRATAYLEKAILLASKQLQKYMKHCEMEVMMIKESGDSSFSKTFELEEALRDYIKVAEEDLKEAAKKMEVPQEKWIPSLEKVNQYGEDQNWREGSSDSSSSEQELVPSDKGDVMPRRNLFKESKEDVPFEAAKKTRSEPEKKRKRLDQAGEMEKDSKRRKAFENILEGERLAKRVTALDIKEENDEDIDEDNII